MTERADVALEHSTSPRIAEVAAPSVEFIAQDVVDTLRGDESTFSGISGLKLLNASGKEDLGGGVFVGITASLQDTQVAFEGRTTPAETGTVTTGSGAAVADRQTFFDTSATFITNGVQRGSLVINFTDNSIAEVFSVESETELQTKGLVNGTGNTYDITDVYHVFNVIQCEMTGGNVVAVDGLGATISPILPTAFTQVVRVSSSSATLTSQSLLEFASYQGHVWIDMINGPAGVDFPIGTRQMPVDNVADALLIAAAVGLDKLAPLGNLTLASGEDVSAFTILGSGATTTTLTVDTGAITTNTQILECTVLGVLDGFMIIRDSVIGTSTVISSFAFQCAMATGATITLAGNDTFHFLSCYSGTPGLGTPIIDMGGSGPSLAMRDYNGGITLINKTGSEAVSLDINSGQVILDSTVTAGTIVVRGIGNLTDNSTGTTNVVTDGLLNQELIADAIFDEDITTHTTTDSFGKWVNSKALTVAKFLGLK